MITVLLIHNCKIEFNSKLNDFMASTSLICSALLLLAQKWPLVSKEAIVFPPSLSNYHQGHRFTVAEAQDCLHTDCLS